MQRYIDADELPKVKFHPSPYTHIVPSDLKGLQIDAYERGWNDAIDAIFENAETADVVERKHGEWVTEYDRWGKNIKTIRGHKCSICGNYLDFDGVNAGRGDPNFCPNCGASMRKETEDG